MAWKTVDAHGWIFVDDAMPPEGEFVLAICGEDSPIGIARIVDDEWETGPTRKRPVYDKRKKYWTGASVAYWMPLPPLPERNEVS